MIRSAPTAKLGCETVVCVCVCVQPERGARDAARLGTFILAMAGQPIPAVVNESVHALCY